MAEQRRNFEPYPRTVPAAKMKKATVSEILTGKKGTRSGRRSWSSKFVCLADKDQHHVLSSVGAKEILVQAGLGEKKVELYEDFSAYEFQQKIIQSFPKLQNAGGFELMRCIANSRQLEPISVMVAKSPLLLKKVIGNGRIYVRPIQKNLDTTPADDDMSPSTPEASIYHIHVV